MAIVQWKRASLPEAGGEADPQSFFERFQEDWNRWLGWSRYPEASGLFDRSLSPAIDVVETEDACTVWVDVPGLEKKDLELSVAANVLTLKGEKKGPTKGAKEQDTTYRDETWAGSFQRSISLPDSVDPDKVTAEFRDGVLKVVVVKKAEHKPRQIPVAVH